MTTSLFPSSLEVVNCSSVPHSKHIVYLKKVDADVVNSYFSNHNWCLLFWLLHFVQLCTVCFLCCGFVRGSQLKLLNEKYLLRSCWMKLWSRFQIGKSCRVERKTDIHLPSQSCSRVQQERQMVKNVNKAKTSEVYFLITYLSCMYTHIKNNHLPKLHKWASWVCQIL